MCIVAVYYIAVRIVNLDMHLHDYGLIQIRDIFREVDYCMSTT